MADQPPAVKSPATVLFTDVRHILCGDLRWLDPSGATVPVTAEGFAPVGVAAQPTVQPRGVRFRAEPGRKMDLDTPTPPGSPVFCDGGLFRTWSLETEFPPPTRISTLMPRRCRPP